MKLVRFGESFRVRPVIAFAPGGLLEVWAPALIADPSAAAEGGSELQVLAEGLAALSPADSVPVDLDEADLAQVDSAPVGLDEAGTDGAGSDPVDLDAAAWGNQAAQVGPVPAGVVEPEDDPGCRVWAVGLAADCHRDEFPVGNPADCLVRKADEYSRDGYTEDGEDDNFAGDTANPRDSPDGWPI